MFCIPNQVSTLKDPKGSKSILRAVMTGHAADLRSLGVRHIITKVDLCLQWHSYHAVMEQYTLNYFPIIFRTQIPVQSLELAISHTATNLRGWKASNVSGCTHRRDSRPSV